MERKTYPGADLTPIVGERHVEGFASVGVGEDEAGIFYRKEEDCECCECCGRELHCEMSFLMAL